MPYNISDDDTMTPPTAAPAQGKFVISEEPEEGPLDPFIDTFKHGVNSAKDLVTGNFNNTDNLPMRDTLRSKVKEGTADRHDYERSFLEMLDNSALGKVWGTAAGFVPEANIVSTSINKWVNPAIVENTGIDPSELQLLELGAFPKVAGKAKEISLSPNALPSYKAGAKMVDMTMHPLSTLGKAVSLPVSALRAGISPLVRGALNIDNPITGGPGLKSSLMNPESFEAAALEKNIPGLNFSAGERTGDSTTRGIEDTLANSAKWGGKFAEANNKNTDAIINKFNGVLDNVYGQETLPENFGTRISTAYNQTINSLNKNRREQAKMDFGAAFDGSDEEGQNILSNNLFRTLQDLRDEGNARLLTDSKALGGKIGKNLLSKLSTITKAGNEQADAITIKELGNGLSDFGEAASDKELPDATRRVYARIYDSLQKDLNDEIENPRGNPERAAQLAIARDNYANNTNKIADIHKTALGNMIGYADHNSQGQLTVTPESIATKFSTLQPSELRQTMKFLDDHHPEVANMGRRYALEQVLRQAQEGTGLRGVGITKPFSKAEFVKKLPDPQKLNALLGDTKAYDDVMDVASATNRLVDWGANKSGSQTFQRNNIFSSLWGFGKGTLIKSLVSDNLANDLLDPLKRNQMAKEAGKISKFLSNTSSKTKELLKDETGSVPINFDAWRQKLKGMRENNKEDDIITTQVSKFNDIPIKQRLLMIKEGTAAGMDANDPNFRQKLLEIHNKASKITDGPSVVNVGDFAVAKDKAWREKFERENPIIPESPLAQAKILQFRNPLAQARDSNE